MREWKINHEVPSNLSVLSTRRHVLHDKYFLCTQYEPHVSLVCVETGVKTVDQQPCRAQIKLICIDQNLTKA